MILEYFYTTERHLIKMRIITGWFQFMFHGIFLCSAMFAFQVFIGAAHSENTCPLRKKEKNTYISTKNKFKVKNLSKRTRGEYVINAMFFIFAWSMLYCWSRVGFPLHCCIWWCLWLKWTEACMKNALDLHLRPNM